MQWHLDARDITVVTTIWLALPCARKRFKSESENLRCSHGITFKMASTETWLITKLDKFLRVLWQATLDTLMGESYYSINCLVPKIPSSLEHLNLNKRCQLLETFIETDIHIFILDLSSLRSYWYWYLSGCLMDHQGIAMFLILLLGSCQESYYSNFSSTKHLRKERKKRKKRKKGQKKKKDKNDVCKHHSMRSSC